MELSYWNGIFYMLGLFLLFVAPAAAIITFGIYYSNMPEKRKNIKKFFYVKIFFSLTFLIGFTYFNGPLDWFLGIFSYNVTLFCKWLYVFLLQSYSVYSISVVGVFLSLGMIFVFVKYINKNKSKNSLLTFLFFLLISILLVQFSGLNFYVKTVLPNILWFLYPNDYSTTFILLYILIHLFLIVFCNYFFRFVRRRLDR